MLYVAMWLAIGYAGGWLAARKGYWPGLGIFVAILFGPLALMVAAFLPKTHAGRAQDDIENELNEEGRIHDIKRNCPRCDRELSLMTRVCPNCEYRFKS